MVILTYLREILCTVSPFQRNTVNLRNGPTKHEDVNFKINISYVPNNLKYGKISGGK